MLELEVVGRDGQRWQDAALIDTGADTSAFPLHWLKRMHILKKECRQQKFETAGGMGKQWRFSGGVTVIARGREIVLDACFVDTPVILLGREDFLVHFEAHFDQSSLRYWLTSRRR